MTVSRNSLSTALFLANQLKTVAPAPKWRENHGTGATDEGLAGPMDDLGLCLAVSGIPRVDPDWFFGSYTCSNLVWGARLGIKGTGLQYLGPVLKDTRLVPGAWLVYGDVIAPTKHGLWLGTLARKGSAAFVLSETRVLAMLLNGPRVITPDQKFRSRDTCDGVTNPAFHAHQILPTYSP